MEEGKSKLYFVCLQLLVSMMWWKTKVCFHDQKEKQCKLLYKQNISMLARHLDGL